MQCTGEFGGGGPQCGRSRRNDLRFRHPFVWAVGLGAHQPCDDIDRGGEIDDRALLREFLGQRRGHLGHRYRLRQRPRDRAAQSSLALARVLGIAGDDADVDVVVDDGGDQVVDLHAGEEEVVLGGEGEALRVVQMLVAVLHRGADLFPVSPGRHLAEVSCGEGDEPLIPPARDQITTTETGPHQPGPLALVGQLLPLRREGLLVVVDLPITDVLELVGPDGHEIAIDGDRVVAGRAADDSGESVADGPLVVLVDDRKKVRGNPR